MDAVAQHAGFNSESSFYRIFKELTGLTPTQYRKIFAKINPSLSKYSFVFLGSIPEYRHFFISEYVEQKHKLHT